MLTHIVIWNYKPEAAPAEREKNLARPCRLSSLAPGVESFAAGFDVFEARPIRRGEEGEELMISDEWCRHPRVKVSIPFKWGTAPDCRLEGVVTILSLGGCLINAPLHASRWRAVFLRMSPNGEGREASVLRGHVKYELEGIGLGVEFAGLTEEQASTIRDTVELHIK